MDDQILVERLLKSETANAALLELYQKYGKLVLYIGRQFGLSDESCEDLLHDVFMKVFQKKETIQDAKKLKSWIAMIARNRAIDIKKIGRKEIMIKTTVEMNIAVPMLNPQVVHNVECQVVLEIIEEIARKSGDDLLKQFYVDGVKAKDIAEQMGVAVSTITTKLTEQRRQFKSMIKTRIESIRSAAE